MLSYTCAHRIFLFNRAVSEQHRPINLSVIMEIFPFLFLSDTTTTSYKWPFGTWNEADENEEVDFPSHLFLMNLNPKSSMWLMVTYTWQWRSIMTRFFFFLIRQRYFGLYKMELQAFIYFGPKKWKAHAAVCLLLLMITSVLNWSNESWCERTSTVQSSCDAPGQAHGHVCLSQS